VRTHGLAQRGRGHGGGGDDEQPTRHGFQPIGLVDRREPARSVSTG
jgi:hypothetical protein